MQRKSDNRPAHPAFRPMVKSLKASFVLLAFMLLPGLSAAHEFTVQECVEGSHFIKNAALARDRGITESFFISKIRDDIEVIRAFPRELRWFVQDEDDASFLIGAASVVFQQPQAARAHQAEFFVTCLSKAKSDGGASSGL